MTQKHFKTFMMGFFALLFVFSLSAEAKKKSTSRKKKAAPTCAEDIAKTTSYFVPNIKDYCSTPKPCAKFKEVVRMEGQGTLSGNRVLTYQGEVMPLGSCDTAFGVQNRCLKPFLSIAADLKKYSVGDIIEMPSMKGRQITLPNGKTMIHPGYFIVDDRGGRIKGQNRFDFFTGSYGLTSSNNAFGLNGFDDPQISNEKACSSSKKFSVIRRGSANYEQALASIDAAFQGSQSPKAPSGSPMRLAGRR